MGSGPLLEVSLGTCQCPAQKTQHFCTLLDYSLYTLAYYIILLHTIGHNVADYNIILLHILYTIAYLLTYITDVLLRE